MNTRLSTVFRSKTFGDVRDRVNALSPCSYGLWLAMSFHRFADKRPPSRATFHPFTPPLLQYRYWCLRMKPLFALFLAVASVVAHPVPEPGPVPANAVAGLLKRAGVVFSSCTVPNTAALTYAVSYFIPSPLNLGFVASMTGHITTWYCYKSRLVSFPHHS